MGVKTHLRCKLSQVLLMYSLLASAAAASLDDKIRANKTYIQLQPGNHTFSGANVSGSLTIMGASAGDTTVECSGAFAVMGALALHNLTVRGCQDCGARLGGIIRTDMDQAERTRTVMRSWQVATGEFQASRMGPVLPVGASCSCGQAVPRELENR